MRSAEELRTEARRLRLASTMIADPAVKVELASRALELAERAEAIAASSEHPEFIRSNINRYRGMLAATTNETFREVLEHFLQDAEEMLQVLGDKVEQLPPSRLVG